MSQEGLGRARAKMQDAGVNDAAIDVFSSYYRDLEQGATGLIPEDSITPLTDVPRLEGIAVTPDQARQAMARTVVIKLNGGLGTSMGMDKAKSLLEVRDGKSFLDLIVEQVLAARSTYGVRLPLLLMNSFNTQADTLEALAGYSDLPVDDLPLDFVQSQEPKLRTDDLTPVEWPANPHLEWCPPGHGDLYVSLLATGILKKLIDAGFAYATVSNSDNLGAAPDATLAGWFAASRAPYAAEVCTRTPMDRKGGHLATRISDGRIVLRDSAQCADEDMAAFTDESRHPYFHTNNLWFDLRRVYDALTERHGVLGLPLIRNVKTVDPTDPESPEVYQVESAMGAAIEVFDGATAIAVPRSRFLPVKTTNELLLVRSDVYSAQEDGSLQLDAAEAPVIDLSKTYKTISEFEARFPYGPPSLKEARTLTVEGDWTFGRDVVVVGDVTLPDEGEPRTVADGERLA